MGALGPLRVRELVAQTLQFIAQGIWPYYLNTGDTETLEKAYPFVYNYLALFPMQENRLPEYRKRKSPDSWDWVDWGVKETADKQAIQIAFYYLALKEAKKMAEVLGKNEDIKWYANRMNLMKPAFNKLYWKNGFYSSNKEKFKDDRANSIAIVSGIANTEYYSQIVDNVLIPNRFSSPHFEWVVEEAMCITGNYEASLARMKAQYKSQVDKKTMSTLYEMFPKGGSYNHAWNAPNTILSKYIAGVRPTKLAWSEFEIMPELVHFNNIKKTIPTVKGNINLEIIRSDFQYQLKLKSPKETEAVIGIPIFDKAISKVFVNGNVIWNKGNFKKEINGIGLEKEDAKYLKFRIPSGDWEIKAIYLKKKY